MAKFYRYETSEILLKFTPTGVLDDYRHIVVSISQKGMVQIDKKENELSIDTEENTIVVPLSQEETGKFAPRQAIIQVNIYYDNSERDVSTTGTIDVLDNLYEEVISDE